LRPIRKFDRAVYNVTAFAQVCQMDIAQMFSFQKYQYFLLLIELFSHRIFTRAQMTKTRDETLHSLDSIIAEGKLEIQVLQSDQGMEFVGMKKQLIERHIHWTPKVIIIV
jgi:hypothetical protein